MPSLDQLKQEIREEASDNPEKFFATSVLKEKGFERGQCENCGLYFWSTDEEREVCGEPECSGGYTFINDSPIEEEYSYIESWKLYEQHMEARGYKSIDRYPVIARWRDDTEFVEAAIYNFQPHVVSGEVEPPAPELVMPQPSLRFNDIDNVGITGRHYVLHNHISQTCFQPPQKYDQDRYFKDLLEFALDSLGIPEQKLILHEDSWGGGGNLGACMEFFVDGLELWNQVYMFYEVVDDGYEELDLKVLDMGMGHERITWISHGTETSYECVMPQVLEKMKNITNVKVDQEMWEDFLPYSGNLNVDEVDDIEEEWQNIANTIGRDKQDLKKSIRPVADLYSVAEHSRALLFALVDGKLPSNTGGGHNLRVIYRRAKDFIERNDWNLDIKDIVEWHAEELQPIFPELLESVEDIKPILEVEEEKYFEARRKAEQKLKNVEDPSLEEMVELYESHGVSPEMMEEKGFNVPEDFYSHITSKQEVVEDQEEKFDVETRTELLYYESPEPYEDGKTVFTGTVEEVHGDWIVLDRTMFYPEGGGQLYDTGEISGEEVVEVQKQDEAVLHKVPGHDLIEGEKVDGFIDIERRKQLTQHHTATHLVNAAAKEVLGNHVWQAGASKKTGKARLDVTHHSLIEKEELENIEEKVREYISEDYSVERALMSRKEAEQEYGFRIYQGGTPPGNTVRLIKINEKDVEACGGTHVTSTSRIGEFVVTGSKKIQDGVIRIEYKAGEAAEKYLETVENRVWNVIDMFDSVESYEDDYRKVEERLCNVFSVEPEQLVDTVERFKTENEELQKSIEKMAEYLEVEENPVELDNTGKLVKDAQKLYDVWKQNEKKLEGLESQLESTVRERIEDNYLKEEVPTENIGLMIQVARKLSKDSRSCIVLVGEKGAVAGSHSDRSAFEELEEIGENVQGDDNFAKTFDI